jgi:hypothetical protein
MLQSLVIILLVGAVVLALYRYGPKLAGGPAVRLPDGRRALAPGRLIWSSFAATSGIALAGLWTLLFVGINPARPDYSTQFNSLLAIIAGFTLASTLIVYAIVLPKVRWDDDAVEKTPVIGTSRTIPWTQLASMTLTGSEDIVLRSDGGTKIRFSSYMRGATELRALCLLRLIERESAEAADGGGMG